MVRFCQIVLYR